MNHDGTLGEAERALCERVAKLEAVAAAAEAEHAPKRDPVDHLHRPCAVCDALAALRAQCAAGGGSLFVGIDTLNSDARDAATQVLRNLSAVLADTAAAASAHDEQP